MNKWFKQVQIGRYGSEAWHPYKVSTIQWELTHSHLPSPYSWSDHVGSQIVRLIQLILRTSTYCSKVIWLYNLYMGWLEDVLPTNFCTVHRCSSTHASVGWKLRTGECPRSVGDSGGWPCENCSRRLEDFVKGEGPRKWYFIIYNIIYNYNIYYIICMCVFHKK